MIPAENRFEPVATGTRVRYIKLGRGGAWETECLRDGTMRFGTWSEEPEHFAAATSADWDRLRQAFLADVASARSATRFVNDTKAFFTATDQLWITFADRLLWWGYLADDPPAVAPDGHGTVRRLRSGWSSHDVNGFPLSMEKLAGGLTKSALYRGTTFELKPGPAAYVVRRVNGQVSPEVARAQANLASIRESARDLIRLLDPRDFELLVDLVFTSSGWRRSSDLGGTHKTVDSIVVLPSTGDTAWIQIKSKADDAVLAESVAEVEALPYDRLFFVHHSGAVHDVDDPRVVIVGIDRLAELVVDAGLVGWLIERAS